MLIDVIFYLFYDNRKIIAFLDSDINEILIFLTLRKREQTIDNASKAHGNRSGRVSDYDLRYL